MSSFDLSVLRIRRIVPRHLRRIFFLEDVYLSYLSQTTAKCEMMERSAKCPSLMLTAWIQLPGKEHGGRRAGGMAVVADRPHPAMPLQDIISSALFPWWGRPWDNAEVAQTGALACPVGVNKKWTLGKITQWSTTHLGSVGIDKSNSQWKKPDKGLGKRRGRLETWRAITSGTCVIGNPAVLHRPRCGETEL